MHLEAEKEGDRVCRWPPGTLLTALCATKIITSRNNNFIKYRTINSFFTKSPEKKIIFFDDIDCININKTHIQTLTDFKKKTYFIFTVLTSEKKKLLTTYKKIIDHEGEP